MNKSKWAEKYIDGVREKPTEAMRFGSRVGRRLGKDRNYLPEVPRYRTAEYKVECLLGDVPLLGYFDFYEPKKIIETKTGKLWTAKRANEHGQISFYDLLLYQKFKIPPEEIDNKLVWLATEEVDNKTKFIKDMHPVVFDVPKTMVDILEMSKRIGVLVEFIHSLPMDVQASMMIE
jgi:hypothetical protein